MQHKPEEMINCVAIFVITKQRYEKIIVPFAVPACCPGAD